MTRIFGLRNISVDRSILLIAIISIVVSCTETSVETGQTDDIGAITISPFLTRVSDLHFDNGDCIGLTIIKGDEMFSDNSPMTFSGNMFSGDLEWYDETDVASDFIAYYPYNEKGTPSSFSVGTDQSSGTSLSDFIVGLKTGVKPAGQAVSMTFKHILAKIDIDMTNNMGSDISSVVLGGSKICADVDVMMPSAAAAQDSETENVRACEVVKNENYTAILVPQEVTMTLVVKTSDEKEYAMELEPMTLEQGMQYEITARLSEDAGLEVKVAGDVEDWGDGGEIGPGEGDGELEELPELEVVEDVCTKMDDLNFMSYCYKNFDVNNDSKVSMSEANAVKSIDCSTASSFKGIEYFSNLESFKLSSVASVDLRYNSALTTLSCSGVSIQSLDLRYNTSLSDLYCYSCKSLTNVIMAKDAPITTIKASAFMNCSALESIVLSDNVVSIGESAFDGCTSLASLTLPNSVTSIGYRAFWGCTSLTSLTLPNSVTSIGSNAFYGCSSLVSVKINENSRISFDGNPFCGCPCKFYGPGASSDNMLLLASNGNADIEVISASASIQGHYTIPSGVLTIGYQAFEHCDNITSITFPESLISIDRDAFYGCNNLASVDASECTALESIGVRAFGYDSLLSLFLIGNTVPSAISTSADYATFYNISNSAILKVPAESVDTYKSSGWNNSFSEILPLD